VSSDEFLNYALQNKRSWEDNGEGVVEELIEKVNKVWAEIEANQDDSTKELSAGGSASD
jgi:hypothetical protein